MRKGTLIYILELWLLSHRLLSGRSQQFLKCEMQLQNNYWPNTKARWKVVN
jgi:hypothetical protein